MPEHSPEHPGNQAPGSNYFPSGDFLESPNLATELTQIADVDAYNLEALHNLDPDQVPEDAVKKRLGWTFWIAAAWIFLIVALALLAPLLEKLGMPDPTQPVCTSRLLAATAAVGLRLDGDRQAAARHLRTRHLGCRAVDPGRRGCRDLRHLLRLDHRDHRRVLQGQGPDRADGRHGRAARLPGAAARHVDRHLPRRQVGEDDRLAIGIVAIPPVARLVRASTLVFAEREFVLAARTLGASNGRVITKEILPNAVLPIVSFGIIGVAVAIVAEGALAFLGLSIPPPDPTWGSMINEGRATLETAPWVTLMPCLVLFLTVLSLNLAGDRLREYFDIREGAL
ncbi:MAG: ABC transporter permease [Acidimicrobiales bacterium]